jgi:signal transduction histidine kinase/ActR/RegA family two-component response regulator
VNSRNPDKSSALLKAASYKRCLYILILLLLYAGTTAAQPPLPGCEQDRLALYPWLYVLEDSTAELTIEQITALPPDSFIPATPRLLAPGYSRSAFWLRLDLSNAATQACETWAFLGTGKLRDIQLFQQLDGTWQRQLAGSRHPFAEWATPIRLTALPIQLPAASQATVFIRVASEQALSMQPLLLSYQGLLQERMAENLADGVVFGVVILLIIISVAVGYILRLGLLLAHAMSVLRYCFYVSTINGYAFVLLWPTATIWDGQAFHLLSALTRILAIAYLRVLLMVRQQPRYCGLYLTFCQAAVGFVAIANVLFPQMEWFAQGSLLQLATGLLLQAGIAGVTIIGHRQRLPYTWFSYLIPSLMLLQALLYYVFHLGLATRSPLEYSWLSISLLPGAALLSYTLVSEVGRTRRREKQALADLDQLKQAEHERLESTVAARTGQLRESLRAQSLLLARISHDLRAPMHGVIDHARQLLKSPQPQEQHLRSIERNARQQLELIDELLEFSQGELKQMELLVAPGYLFGFLREIEEEGRFLVARQRNRLQCQFADDLPLLVSADFRRLRQILVNLLVNAGKFTQDGLVELRVDLLPDSTPTQPHLQFSVADSGIGIAPSERERLLQAFVRGSNTGTHEGSGLGLFIVKQMLARMDSTLTIGDSDLGGSLFQFSLRLEPAAEHELDKVYIEDHVIRQPDNERRILLVDDVAVTREMLYELLAGYGFEPLAVANGEDALAVLAQQPVDLLISDQRMPGMDGWALLHEVRRRWPLLPVLLYSASPPRRPDAYSPKLGFDASLLKPAATGDLLDLIDTLLQPEEVVSDEPA